jgi:hypothetical protein
MSVISTGGARIDRWDNGRPAHREEARLIEALKLERSSRYLCSEGFITFISKPHDDAFSVPPFRAELHQLSSSAILLARLRQEATMTSLHVQPSQDRARNAHREACKAAFFRPTAGGYLCGAPNPYVFGGGKHYIVTEAQREAILDVLAPAATTRAARLAKVLGFGAIGLLRLALLLFLLVLVASLTERAVNFIVKEAAERAGVNPAASIHWLRHAHASHAIDNGAPITLVSATLGHANLKTTSVYAHARPGESSGRYLKTKF